MKKVVLLSLVVFLSISCTKKEQEPEVANVNFTPCQQTKVKSAELSGGVNVEFTNEGVKITHFDFEVTCDFSAVDVTHTFVNGVLRITQQSSPSHADCICYTDVSYTINGILQDEVNVIFINGMQVYCWNDNNQSNCDQDVIVCPIEFENAPNHPLGFGDVRIEGNCLKMKIGASGCTGNNWVLKLIAVESDAVVYPPEWILRVSLDHIGVCAAYFENERSFNIEDLQLPNTNKVRLNILSAHPNLPGGHSILYEY